MLKNYFETRRGIKELERLTYRELNDIGLTQGDIYRMRKETGFFSALFSDIKTKFGIKSTKEFVRRGYFSW